MSLAHTAAGDLSWSRVMTCSVPIEVQLTADDVAKALCTDVLTGLTAPLKWLPPKWFYDARGSALFERITRLEEYYPTRTEHAILAARADEFAAAARVAGVETLVELGSGSSEKTRLLLDAQSRVGGLRRFVPLDVSEPALTGSVAALRRRYPWLEVHGVVADFTKHLGLL